MASVEVLAGRAGAVATGLLSAPLFAAELTAVLLLIGIAVARGVSATVVGWAVGTTASMVATGVVVPAAGVATLLASCSARGWAAAAAARVAWVTLAAGAVGRVAGVAR